MAIRKFAAEGSLHLYSSQANPLYPSELYLPERWPEIREALELCNIYLITRRRRIVPEPSTLRVEAGWLHGDLHIRHQAGWVQVPFRYRLHEGHHAGKPDHVTVAADGVGSYLAVHNHLRQGILLPTYALIAEAECDLGAATDLEVLYIGQGVGRTGNRIAVDRLVAHDKLQRILAETLTDAPDAEVIVLMYRFEHAKMHMSTGGDLTLEPTATITEEVAHFRALQAVTFSRKQQVDLAEAALIHHFQPPYNETFVNSNFAAKRRMKLLNSLDAQDVTGLIVEISTSYLRSRLWSRSRKPVEIDDLFPAGLDGSHIAQASAEDRARWQSDLHDMVHAQIAQIALTTTEERNTFLHGMKWLDDSS
jgi:hypothetical protein